MAETIEVPSPRSTVDSNEVEHFSKLAADWWNPKGAASTLHQINPFRLEYLRRQIIEHFDGDPNDAEPLKGLRILDVGCGGGLVAEPLARLGAKVVGIDPAADLVEVARVHTRQSGLDIDYRLVSAEGVAATGEMFDVVVGLEVVEHVSDVSLFISGSQVRALLHPPIISNG